MKKSWIFLLTILALVAAGYAFLEYNKPHADTATLKPAFVLSASELLQAYETDEAAANARYLDQPLEVYGVVREVLQEENSSSLLLETDSMLSSVSCNLLEKHTQLEAGDSVRVRGICTGYLLDVVLVRAVVIEP